MSDKIRSYAELRELIRVSLRIQHPEWVKSDGNSPICDFYDARSLSSLALSLRGKTKRNLRCAIAWKNLKTTHSEDQSEMNATQLLHNLGQSIWLDNIAQFAKVGVNIETLATQLQDEGAESFVKSWKELMGVIASKSDALKEAA